MGKTCCFIGHGEIWGEYEQVACALAAAVERHIVEYGVTEFFVGHYGTFDYMAARTVKEAKTRHSGIHLYLMLPYHPGEGRPLPDLKNYDNIIYPLELAGVPKKVTIPRLNRLMVEDSNFAIAYVCHPWGGAATTLEYAKRREKKGLIQIENLGEKE